MFEKKTQSNLSPEDSSERISGTIERVTFHNEDNGFCVLRIKVKGRRDLVTVVGNAVLCRSGEFVECQGTWINDKSYGMQFRAESMKLVPPTTQAGMEKYLSSGLIKGIGPFFAKKLVKKFGDKLFDVLDNHPEKLRKMSGIGETRLTWIKKAWHDQKAVRDIMIFLQSNGIGTARAVRIYKVYGDKSIDLIKQNPYNLAQDVHGIGFKIADSLAMNLGVAKDSLMRAEAGLHYVLQDLSQRGHTAVLRKDLLERSIELLEIKEDVLLRALDNQVQVQNLVTEESDQQNLVALPLLYQSEISIAQNIKRLQAGEIPWPRINPSKALEWLDEKTHFKLSPSQREAVSIALQNKVMIITGGPGVGKTTLVNSILKIVRAKCVHVMLCAPTGRAAKRLSETSHLPAKTIHRLLEYDPMSHQFKRNYMDPLRCDMVVVDEVSMVDTVLMHHLLKAIPSHAALLIVGDQDQLPSVGPGQVLADLIASKKVPTVRLTEIFRQAKNSRIIVNAHRINQGLFPLKHDEENEEDNSDFYLLPTRTPEEMRDKLLTVVLDRLPKRFGFDPLEDIQILTPMHRGPVGTRSLNATLQEKFNGTKEPKVTRFGTVYAPGDKIIQTVNNYDKDVFNGDIGMVRKVDLENDILTALFDGQVVEYDFNELDELQLAYATSIHKSQGSEYPVVVLLLANQHFMLLARNLLYTAVTRGKKMVVVISQMQALAMAVKNLRDKGGERLTRLKSRIVD